MSRIDFSPEDWSRIEQANNAWWVGELDRPLIYLSVTRPSSIKPYNFLSNYPLDIPAERIVDQYATMLEDTRFYADAFPWWWMNFGPGMAAGFLGCEVHSVTQPAETVWFSPAKSVNVQDLHFRYDPENVWWKRVQDVTAAAVERFGNQVAVSHTDLGGNLDILASFRDTQNLLIDLIEQPEEVLRLVYEANWLWRQYYDELDAMIRGNIDGLKACRGTSCWTPIWSPGKTYMLQSDFAYMISPKMFEKFVMPDLVACCDFLDHGFYHLDGKNQIPHLDMLLSIPRLRGVQWIPGDGQPTPDHWLPLLKRIRDSGKLCQEFVSPEGALRIVRNLGGKGFLLVISAPEEWYDHPEEVDTFLKAIEKEDIGLNPITRSMG
jgi:hypothetical protein